MQYKPKLQRHHSLTLLFVVELVEQQLSKIWIGSHKVMKAVRLIVHLSVDKIWNRIQR